MFHQLENWMNGHYEYIKDDFKGFELYEELKERLHEFGEFERRRRKRRNEIPRQAKTK